MTSPTISTRALATRSRQSEKRATAEPVSVCASLPTPLFAAARTGFTSVATVPARPRLRPVARFDRSSPSDGDMLEARASDDLGFIKIAAVEDHRLLQVPLQRVEIGAAKLLPFSDDD